jgi:hypothetical protein
VARFTEKLSRTAHQVARSKVSSRDFEHSGLKNWGEVEKVSFLKAEVMLAPRAIPKSAIGRVFGLDRRRFAPESAHYSWKRTIFQEISTFGDAKAQVAAPVITSFTVASVRRRESPESCKIT